MMRRKSPGQLLTFYGSALVVCLIVSVAAFVNGSVALGALLLIFAVIMGGILASRFNTG
jgi:hypothetical protein